MEVKLKLDTDKYRFFIFENKTWLIFLEIQTKEILYWDKLLQTALKKDGDRIAKKEESNAADLYHKELLKQKSEMEKLNHDIGRQQEQLDKNCKSNMHYDIESYRIQDILRFRAKVIEISFIELKYNFMIYLSNVY